MAPTTNVASDSDALVRFAKRVSHDINNFSTVVLTYSELLLSDIPDADPIHADVAEIHRAADATVRYLQRVTQFSRVGSMRRMPTAVDDGLVDATAVLAAEQGDRPVQLFLGGGRIHADSKWWRDVVIELLRNAHEAAPAGSTIVVRSAVDGDTVTVDVEDDGAGIPDDLLETVTEPFVTSKQGVSGAGIGLAMADMFMRTLGGSIHFTRIDGAAAGTRRTRVRAVLPADTTAS